MQHFRRLIDRITGRPRPLPTSARPTYLPEDPSDLIPQATDEYLKWFRDRIRAHPISYKTFQNVTRILEYVGDAFAIQNVYVPQHKFISFDALVIAADGSVASIHGGFRTGEQWSAQRADRIFKSKLIDKLGSKDRAYSFIKGATIKINYYLTEYVPNTAFRA